MTTGESVGKFFAFLLLLAKASSQVQDPVIELPNGQILGREATTSQGRSYYAFEKVPYAAPPTGELRFKAPQPAQNWDGVWNATVLDVACYQLQAGSVPQSEDCLFVNIYTPHESGEDTELLPVMFFIYGGASIMSWSGDYQPDLFIDNGVIFVSFNYRVGSFGYLSTQDDVIPGNNGMKDQLLALQWTHDNIQFFGGDPNKVTIFGQSAGAGSCAYLLLTQKAQGLFWGAIMESGSALGPGSLQRDAKETAFGTAAVLNSTFETSRDSQALLEYLQSLDADDVNAASFAYYTNNTSVSSQLVDQGSFFGPVVEAENADAFITKKMYGLFKAGSILPVPTIMGFNSEEILLKMRAVDDLQSLMETIDEHLEYVVPYDMQITDLDSQVAMGQEIRNIYTGGEPFSDHLGDAVRYGSDQAVNRAMIKQAEFVSQVAPVYFYQFSYDGTLGGFDLHIDGAESVAHTEELSYLFCNGGFAACDDTSYPELDLLTRQRLLKIWTDFAKYQHPTPEPSELLQNITWPQVSTEDGDFLYVDINGNLEIKNHPKEATYTKWVELYDSLGYDDFDTY